MKLHSADYDYARQRMTISASDCKLKVDFHEKNTGNCVYSCDKVMEGTQSIWVEISRKYHCDYVIKIYVDGVLSHIETTSLRDRTVLVRLDSVAIGDTLAWFPQVLEFQKATGCRVVVSTFHNYLLDKFKSPDIIIGNPNETYRHDVCYKVGVFEDPSLDPCNFRTKPLQKCCSDILGIPYRERHLDLRHLAGGRPIKEKYAVICTTSTMDCKEWQNKKGWQEVVDALNAQGLKVVCVPKPTLKLEGLYAAEVDKDIVKGALTYIRHAELFVGLPSGLTWVSRTVGTWAVMISGFSKDFAEYKSGLDRVTNTQVCNGCYNDTAVKYDRYRHWCPRNKGFECTKAISGADAIAVIRRAPAPVRGRKRILAVLPHCSTGGLPQYFLEKLKVLRREFDVYVVEWSFNGHEFDVQRNQIRTLSHEFIELGAVHRNSLIEIARDIVPDVVHFEEFPDNFSDNWIIRDFTKKYNGVIYHTSHSSRLMDVDRADKYIFPSAYQKKLYPFLDAEVLEYPIIERPAVDARESAILNVGILSRHKNQGYLCEVAKFMPETKFYFAGARAGNFEDYWRPVVTSAPKNCIFLGQQDQDQIQDLYNSCSIMVHPSLLELAPVVFTEALGSGCQVFTNWLNTYDSLSYKEHLNRLTMNPDRDAELLRQQLSPNAGYVRPPSTYEVFKQKVIELYL